MPILVILGTLPMDWIPNWVMLILIVCALGSSSPRGRIHLSRIYYGLLLLAAAIMAITIVLGEVFSEARALLLLLFVIEMAFSLPLVLYVGVANIVHE